MIFYIDNRRQPENLFWNSVHGIASQTQMEMLLDGKKLIIGALFVIVMLITCLEMNKLKDKSIIDEIRMDVM